MNSGNQYLYVLEQKLPGIARVQIQPDGYLVQIELLSPVC